MPPLVPGGIPNDWHGRLVERDFKFPANIAVDGAIAVEVKPTQRRVEAAVALFGQERQNTRGEERLTTARALTSYQDRTEATIRKERGRGRILQQRVIASPQFRLSQDIESPLGRAMVVFEGASGSEFQLTE